MTEPHNITQPELNYIYLEAYKRGGKKEWKRIKQLLKQGLLPANYLPKSDFLPKKT